MSSDQLDSKVPSRPTSPTIHVEQPDDIPLGFEFELEENTSQLSPIQADNSIRMPDFDRHRHPNVKLFVMTSTILGCSVLIYQAIRNIPREYHWVLFTDQQYRQPSVVEYAEMILRISMDLLFPFSLILSFLATHLSISMEPGLAFRIRNPVPIIAKFLTLAFFHRCFVNFVYSISLLQCLSTSGNWLFWEEYLTVTCYGIFWMFQLLNVSIFSRLTVFHFIRARESFEMRQMALDA
uniref:Transmembrane protein n=1 Tax=Caenorhabditis tropicalis TaxID=1561998 RepID=A0A1I7UJE9_9PELO